MRSRWMVCMLVVAALGAAIPVAAEQGVTDTEILLGGSNSFSGPLAFTGTQLTRFGVDLYFRVLNDAGGVHGRRIRTIYYDDGYRPQDAVANTRKLVEQDNIFAVIAPQGSPPVVATLAYLEQNKVPLLFPFQSSTETRNRKYVFSGLVLTLYSQAVSHVNDKLEPAQMIAASSALLLLNGSAAAVGPTLAGSLIAAFGPPAYFVMLATLTGTLTVYDLWRKSRRRPVPAEQKGPFISAQPQSMSGEIVASGLAAAEEERQRHVDRTGEAAIGMR